jgi:hypothetical protein
MDYQDQGLRRFEEDIIEIVRFFGLDEGNVEVEFFTPRTQAILVERVESWRFRIHINVQEKRIISVRQIEPGVAAAPPEVLARYKAFMK